MGTQDHDYYQEKHQKIGDANRCNSFGHLLDNASNRKRGRYAKAGSLRYLLYPALMMGSLCCSADAYVKPGVEQNSPLIVERERIYVSVSDYAQPSKTDTPASPQNLPLDIGLESRGVSITADAKGHFRGMVLINNVPMPFLIDTGATDTVVPAKMAVAAKLPYGRYVQANTAGGKVAIRETSINSLKLGNAEVNNLKAQMNDHLNEVLIGMSTLRYFTMNQNGDTLTLVVKMQTNPGASFQNETSPAERPSNSTIKKTVTCDHHQVCTTKYSDH